MDLSDKVDLLKNTKIWIKDYILIETMIVIAILFYIINPQFISINNIFSLFRTASIMGLMALGLNIIVIVGGFDISFAAIANFASVVSIIFLLNDFTNLSVIWISSILAAVVLSLINSIFIIYIGVPAFITTLATMGFVTGISRYLTFGGQNTYPRTMPPGFSILGRYDIAGIVPFPVVIFLFISIIILVLMEYTPFGRKCYAVGSNAEVARHVGIEVNKIKISSFIITGLIYGIAGIVMSSYFGVASSDMGENYLLSAITAVFLGATFMSVGHPNIKGTLVSVCLIALLINGFVMINLSFFLRDLILGIILIIAIAMIKLVKK